MPTGARQDDWDEAHDAGDTATPRPPERRDLVGRAIAITATGFVFLLAFALSSMWSSARDSRSAAVAEAVDHQRLVALSQELPESSSLQSALAAYADDVRREKWPLMQSGDDIAAYRAQADTDHRLSMALLQVQSAGGDKSPAWATVASTADDMLNQARSRIDNVPHKVSGVIALVFVLGLVNLVLTAVFQPAPGGTNTFLLGTIAAMIAVMLFALVEVSNPYLGAMGIDVW